MNTGFQYQHLLRENLGLLLSMAERTLGFSINISEWALGHLCLVLLLGEWTLGFGIIIV